MTAQTRPDRTFEPAFEHVFRAIAEEAILVPVRAGATDLDSIFTLNEVGAEIWRDIEAGKTPGEIAEALTVEFEVERAEAMADVEAFIATLLEKKLVRVKEPGVG